MPDEEHPRPDAPRAEDAPSEADRPQGRCFIHRLKIKNYKSIRAANIQLHPFTVFVGPNGAGKSNIIDALRFVSEALGDSLANAVRQRGGIAEVRTRSKSKPFHLGISLQLQGEHWQGEYAFEIAAKSNKRYDVKRERAFLAGGGAELTSSGPKDLLHFDVRSGKLDKATPDLPVKVEPDSLFLKAISGMPSARPLYDALVSMGFYNINPDSVRTPHPPTADRRLLRDGSNLPSILREMKQTHPKWKERLEEFLKTIVPGIIGVEAKALAQYETIEFRQEGEEKSRTWAFPASSMSDGTLRALGCLVALYQRARRDEPSIPLVAVEEPETSLHPAAARALTEAMLEASLTKQVLATSHSNDLLDTEDVPANAILAVASEQGETIVSPPGPGIRDLIERRLFSPGELLSMRQVEPDRDCHDKASKQLELFGSLEKTP